ncbi:MAG: hypothetical protein NVS9B10_11810 [Nevskia sp.]
MQPMRIGQIAVTVRDLPRAEAFYRDVLGVQHLFSAGPRLSFFDCGGVRLMLGLAEPGQPPTASSILYFVVDDIEAAFARLQAQSVTIVEAPHRVAKMPDHDLWLGFFEDGEGNTMSLMMERRPPAA